MYFNVSYNVINILPVKKSEVNKKMMNEEWDWGSTKMGRNFQNKTHSTSIFQNLNTRYVQGQKCNKNESENA